MAFKDFFKSKREKKKGEIKEGQEKAFEEKKVEVSPPDEQRSVPDLSEENPLYDLYLKWKNTDSCTRKTFEEIFWDYITTVQAHVPELNREATKEFFQQLKEYALVLLVDDPITEDIDGAGDGQNSHEDAQPEVKAIDITAKIYVDSSEMSAYLCLFPPLNGGSEELDREYLNILLRQEGVTYGLDDALIDQLLEKKSYLQMVCIAQGTRPVDGVDGTVKDHFKRESDVEIQTDENDIADFKNLNAYQSVKKNDVICDFTLPTPGEPGKTVTGRVLTAVDGKPVPVPQGKNTVLTEDKTKLLAGLDGWITFDNNKFYVSQKLVIEGNVDTGSGNVEFEGDIIIKGDVRNGFVVKATGSVMVYGMVEGATIKAGGSITIAKGMNGNNRGSLEAKEDVKCSFLENSTVYTEGNVIAGSIVNCDVASDNCIQVTNGQGIIIGGSIKALRSVEAKRIGSQVNGENHIVLGYTRDHNVDMSSLQKSLKETKKVLEQIEKNVNYLEGLEQIPTSKKEVYSQLVEQLKLYRRQERDQLLKIDELKKKEVDVSQCRVKAKIIYPFTKITLVQSSLLIKEVASNCNIYFSTDENELKLGLS